MKKTIATVVFGMLCLPALALANGFNPTHHFHYDSDNAPQCDQGCHATSDDCVPDQPPVDVCPNIDGAQATVPDGDQITDGQCVPIPPPPPTCSDDQTLVDGQCVDNATSTPPTDTGGGTGTSTPPTDGGNGTTTPPVDDGGGTGTTTPPTDDGGSGTTTPPTDTGGGGGTTDTTPPPSSGGGGGGSSFGGGNGPPCLLDNSCDHNAGPATGGTAGSGSPPSPPVDIDKIIALYHQLIPLLVMWLQLLHNAANAGVNFKG